MPRWSFELPPTTVEEMLRWRRVDELRELARHLGIKPPPHKESVVVALGRELRGERLPVTLGRLGRLQQAALAQAVHSVEGKVDWFQFEARHGASAREVHRGLLELFMDGRGYVPRDLLRALQALLPEPSRPPLPTAGPLEPGRAEQEGLSIFLAERAAPRDLFTVLALTEAGRLRVGEKTKTLSTASARELCPALSGGDYFPIDWTPNRYTSPIGPIRGFAWALLIQEARLANAEGTRLYLTQAGKKALASLRAATIPQGAPGGRTAKTSASQAASGAPGSGSGPPALQASLARAAAPVLQEIWESWLGADLDEFSRVEAIRGRGSKGGRHMTPAAERRDAIADALAELPVGEWVAFDDFDRYVRAAGHLFAVSREPAYLYIGELQYGSLGGYGLYGAWRAVERRYLMAFLLEYAASVGIIDVAYRYPDQAPRDFDDLWGTDHLPYLSRYDGLAYLRLTRLGAWCLGVSEAYEPPGLSEAPAKAAAGRPQAACKAPLAMDGQGRIVAAGELLPADVVFVDRFARRLEPSPASRRSAERGGGRQSFSSAAGPLAWQLDRERLLSAAEAGVDLAEVRAFLKDRTGAALPEEVAFLLDEVEEAVRRIREVGRGIIFEAADPDLAQRLASDAALARHVVAVTGRHLVVEERGATAFRQRLRKLGFGVSGLPGGQL